jgi:hypothetical protein
MNLFTRATRHTTTPFQKPRAKYLVSLSQGVQIRRLVLARSQGFSRIIERASLPDAAAAYWSTSVSAERLTERAGDQCVFP